MPGTNNPTRHQPSEFEEVTLPSGVKLSPEKIANYANILETCTTGIMADECVDTTYFDNLAFVSDLLSKRREGALRTENAPIKQVQDSSSQQRSSSSPLHIQTTSTTRSSIGSPPSRPMTPTTRAHTAAYMAKAGMVECGDPFYPDATKLGKILAQEARDAGKPGVLAI